MKISISVANDVCTVYFEPIPKAGYGVLGGDITVEVDMKTQDILNLERGQ